MSTAELAVSYAALILADDKVDITVRPLTLNSLSHGRSCRAWAENANCSQADKLQTLISAAGVADVEPIWTTLFAKVRNYSR
jgi:large subunit ribosomal protein LP1